MKFINTVFPVVSLVLRVIRGALGVSVWGNEEVHEGVTQMVHSLNNINSMVHSLSNQVKHFILMHESYIYTNTKTYTNQAKACLNFSADQNVVTYIIDLYSMWHF